jgi:hypothetical protein
LLHLNSFPSVMTLSLFKVLQNRCLIRLHWSLFSWVPCCNEGRVPADTRARTPGKSVTSEWVPAIHHSLHCTLNVIYFVAACTCPVRCEIFLCREMLDTC